MAIKELDPAPLSGLGIRDKDVQTIERALRRERGVIFVCGPPGSGRRSAMYSLLCSVNDVSQSLAAAERSLEHPLTGVSQTELGAGERLADWLYLISTADADVLMVSPLDTVVDATSVVRAASTSVVIVGSHAESSIEPLCQLLEMGAPPRLICHTISCVIYTRLAPRLCPYCRRQADMPDASLAAFPILQHAAIHMRAYEARGCSRCDDTGRRGLVGLYEVREVGPQLEAILAGQHDPGPLVEAGLCTTALGLMGDALVKSDAGLVDLHDLSYLTAQCPDAVDPIPFWEN